MLLHHVAAHPNIGPELLDELMERATANSSARPPIAPLRVALAGNPAISHERRKVLLRLQAAVAPEAFSVPGLTPDQAIDLLGTVPVVEEALTALRSVPDPDGVLRNWVRQERPGSLRIAAHVLQDHSAPVEMRLECAVQLAGNEALTPGDTARIAAFVRQLIITDPDAGKRAATTIIKATTKWGRALRKELTVQLGRLPDGPAPGEPAWFTDPATSVQDVKDWARAGGASRWARALRARVDPTGDLARAAMAAYPSARWVLERVVRTEQLPAGEREQAARALHARPSTPWELLTATTQLLEVASASFVTWFLTENLGGLAQLTAVAGRPDLTPGDVSQVARRRRQVLATAQPNAAWYARRVWLEAPQMWLRWLATYPAPHDGRGGAVTALCAQDAMSETLGTALRALDPAVPATFVTAARALPVSELGASVGTSTPVWLRPLHEVALGELVAVTRTRESATVLLALAETFPGTVAELCDVVVGVTA